MKKDFFIKMMITTIVISFLLTSFSSAQYFSEHQADNQPQHIYQISFNIDYSLNDIIFDTFLGYDQVKLKEGYFINDVGKPMLPTQQITIAIPSDMIVETIQLNEYETTTLQGEYIIMPAQPPQTFSGYDRETFTLTEPNTVIYSSNQPYPPYIIELILCNIYQHNNNSFYIL